MRLLPPSLPASFPADAEAGPCERVPRPGPLSQMLVTGLATLVVLGGIVSPTFRAHFGGALSAELEWVFLVSVALMVAHKVESFQAREFDECPVYLASGQAPWARNAREAVFRTFAVTFLFMLGLVYLAFLGPPWHLLILTIWVAQGLHEVHHAAKSLARHRLYPGTLTSLLFVGVMSGAFFPHWHDALFKARGAAFLAYYLLLAALFAGFYVEDRRWLARSRHAGAA